MTDKSTDWGVALYLQLALCWVGLVLLLPPTETIALLPDSFQFIEFAEYLFSQRIFSERGEELTRALTIRTPIYPFLIGASSALAGSIHHGLQLLHLLIGLFIMSTIMISLRNLCPPIILGITYALIAKFHLSMEYYTALTEWTTFNLLLLFLVIVAKFSNVQRERYLFFLCLLCSIITLTHPSYIVTFIVPAFVFLRTRTLPSFGASALGALPLILWVLCNFYRLGVPVVTPFGGANLYGVATIIGHAEVEEGDSKNLRTFIVETNKEKFPPPGEHYAPELFLPYGKYEDAYSDNMWKIGEELLRTHSWSRVAQNDLMMTYSLRTISSFPLEYVRYVLLNFKIYHWPPIHLLLSCALIVVLLKRERSQAVGWGVLTILVIHLVQTALCSVIEQPLMRYYNPTVSALFFSMLASCAIWIAQSWKKA